MQLFKSRDVYDGIEDLLERERTAVLSGDYDKLHRLVAEKERLMASAQHGATDPARLARLGDMAKRNQTLLDAAARGFRAVADMLSGKTDAPAFFTYGRDGSRMASGDPKNQTTRRA